MLSQSCGSFFSEEYSEFLKRLAPQTPAQEIAPTINPKDSVLKKTAQILSPPKSISEPIPCSEVCAANMPSKEKKRKSWTFVYYHMQPAPGDSYIFIDQSLEAKKAALLDAEEENSSRTQSSAQFCP